jgi:hypothetical protein
MGQQPPRQFEFERMFRCSRRVSRGLALLQGRYPLFELQHLDALLHGAEDHGQPQRRERVRVATFELARLAVEPAAFRSHALEGIQA